ncbi:unnamed protein product [Umbelopsis vinacea]
MDAIKRSYHAMQRIENLNPKHKRVLHERFNDIADGLFSSFQPNSHAELNHVCKIMMDMIQVDCYNMLELTIMKDNAGRLFDLMLPYLTHNGVVDVILRLLFRTALPSDSSQRDVDSKRVECHITLQKLGFLEWLTKAMQMEGEQEFVDSVFRFFVRLIEEAAQYDNGYHLFKSLEGPQADQLIATFVIEEDEINRIVAIDALRALIMSGSVGITRSIQNGVGLSTSHGPLHTASKKSQELLLKYIPNLCNVLVQDRVVKPLRRTSLKLPDLDMLEIVYETIRNSDFGVKALVNLAPAFWKLLVQSFFELSHHNIFHNIFYKFFCLVLETHHGPTLRVFIRKQQLITRMIDVYQDKSQDTSNRGHILLMLNHLRLAADAEPHSEVAQLVIKHPRFISFVPTLREETIRQISPLTEWPLALGQRPAPHIGPSPPLRSSSLTPYGVTLPLSNNADDHMQIEEFGIDLGSRWFDHDAIVIPESRPISPSEFSSRRTSLHSESGESTQSETESSAADSSGIDLNDPLFWGGSLTPEASPKKKQKRKKKKPVTEDAVRQ